MSATVPSRPARLALRAGVGLASLGVNYVVICAVILGMALKGKRRPLERTPVEAGFTAEAVTFPAADGITLRGWFFPAPGRDRAVVKLHGLDGNCFSGNSPGLVRRFVDHGFNVLVFDFRSQGASDGEDLGLGWRERLDVRGAVDLLLQRGFKAGRMALHGSSYGAATSLLSAAMIPEVAAVVADSPFADARDLMNGEIARRVGFSSTVFLPGIMWVGRVAHDLDMEDIPPMKAVPGIAPRPILFIHGEADSRIPAEHSRRLKAASRNPRDELWLLPGVEHTKGFEQDPEAYFSRVSTFLDSALP
ncbi:MAG: alpha/beta fold hydrolase [Myxococcota bacterium]